MSARFLDIIREIFVNENMILARVFRILKRIRSGFLRINLGAKSQIFIEEIPDKIREYFWPDLDKQDFGILYTLIATHKKTIQATCP